MSIARKQIYPQGNVVEIFNLKVSPSANDWQNANSSPIDIGLPASGVGYYYRVTNFQTNITFQTVAYTSTVLSIGATTAVPNFKQLQNLAIGFGQSAFVGSFDPVSTLISNAYVENDTISLYADADSLVGDTILDCYITVEKVEL
jgi:hypothetical protein